jgi:hypothetical protein
MESNMVERRNIVDYLIQLGIFAIFVVFVVALLIAKRHSRKGSESSPSGSVSSEQSVSDGIGGGNRGSESFMEWMWDHPPRCVSGIVHEAAEQLAQRLRREYGEDSTCFGVHCTCGNRVLGVSTLLLTERGQELIVPPISIVCDKCGQETVIFDSEKHGWDAETGAFAYKHEGVRSKYGCPKCKGDVFEIAVSFQYGIDQDEFRELLEDSEFKRRQDFFDWFCVIVLCRSCGEICEIVSYECA